MTTVPGGQPGPRALDLTVLQTLDRLQEAGRLSWADALDVARECGIDSGDDRQRERFVVELEVGRSDGLLTFDIVAQLGHARQPRRDEYAYLSTLRNFRLLTAGRDRARGQIVVPADPPGDRDDQRRFPLRVIQDAARDLGEQLDRREAVAFFSDCGIAAQEQAQVIDTAAFVEELLSERLARGTAGRREVRRFLGGWLSGELELAPAPGVRATIERKLARAGWFLREGCLEIGEPQRQAAEPDPPTSAIGEGRPAIFVVHGHQGRDTVARTLERICPAAVVILDEQPNRGQTIIEKYEQAAASTSYAVVLMTDDDVGGPDNDRLGPRARQNVIFEFGYFVASLGRRNVAVLRAPGVESFSDIDGIVWIGFGADGGWRVELARELTTAGLPVDWEALRSLG
ncbi:MAG: TIR domain-containing protein [Solirubrobacteraceae bacterium]